MDRWRPSRTRLLALLVLAACTRSKTYHLPQADSDPELAFAVLYDSHDQVSSIGPVVRRQNLTGYTLESKDDGLKPRLFIEKIASLQTAAKAACSGLTGQIEQVACRDRVDDCSADPTLCLRALPAESSCGDRLPLMSLSGTKVFAPDDRGNLLQLPDTGPLFAQLQLCGPNIKPSCPILRAGFAVSEQGAFRCVAPARQHDCTLDVDLADCGLGGAVTSIASDGSVAGTVQTDGCTIGQAMSGELSSGTTGFAISCATRRFVLTHMEVLFGASLCPRHGPGAFEPGRLGNSLGTSSAITGLKAFAPSGWQPRYLVLGSGYDDCAVDGCTRSQRPFNCTDCCIDCTMDNRLNGCIDDGAWPTCVSDFSPPSSCGISITAIRSIACIERCTRFCNDPGSDCYNFAQGHVLAITSTAAPERDVKRYPLQAGTPDPASGGAALLLLGDASHPTIIAAGRAGLHVFSAAARDKLAEVQEPPTVLSPDLLVAGIAAVPSRADEIAVFGRTAGSSPKGEIDFVRVAAGPPPALSLRAAVVVPDLPSIDAIAFAGASGMAGANDVVVLVSTAPPFASSTAMRLAFRSIDGSTPTPPLVLSGLPTSIASVPGGGFIVGVDLGAGTGEIDVFSPSGTGFGMAAKLPVLKHLKVGPMVADPMSSRIYVGFEPIGDVADQGNALIGLLDYHQAAPSMTRLVPALIKTADPALTSLEYDPFSDELVAVSSTRNRITQIMLLR